MVEELAEVRFIDGDTAWLETRRKSACGSCQMKSGCGSGVLAQFFSKRTALIKVSHVSGVRVGDKVTVGMPEEALSKGSFMTYMAPILSMLLWASLVGWLFGFDNDGAVLLGGVFGFLCGFFYAKRFSNKLEEIPEYQPVIIGLNK